MKYINLIFILPLLFFIQCSGKPDPSIFNTKNRGNGQGFEGFITKINYDNASYVCSSSTIPTDKGASESKFSTKCKVLALLPNGFFTDGELDPNLRLTFDYPTSTENSTNPQIDCSSENNKKFSCTLTFNSKQLQSTASANFLYNLKVGKISNNETRTEGKIQNYTHSVKTIGFIPNALQDVGQLGSQVPLFENNTDLGPNLTSSCNIEDDTYLAAESIYKVSGKKISLFAGPIQTKSDSLFHRLKLSLNATSLSCSNGKVYAFDSKHKRILEIPTNESPTSNAQVNSIGLESYHTKKLHVAKDGRILDLSMMSEEDDRYFLFKRELGGQRFPMPSNNLIVNTFSADDLGNIVLNSVIGPNIATRQNSLYLITKNGELHKINTPTISFAISGMEIEGDLLYLSGKVNSQALTKSIMVYLFDQSRRNATFKEEIIKIYSQEEFHPTPLIIQHIKNNYLYYTENSRSLEKIDISNNTIRQHVAGKANSPSLIQSTNINTIGTLGTLMVISDFLYTTEFNKLTKIDIKTKQAIASVTLSNNLEWVGLAQEVKTGVVYAADNSNIYKVNFNKAPILENIFRLDTLYSSLDDSISKQINALASHNSSGLLFSIGRSLYHFKVSTNDLTLVAVSDNEFITKIAQTSYQTFVKTGSFISELDSSILTLPSNFYIFDTAFPHFHFINHNNVHGLKFVEAQDDSFQNLFNWQTHNNGLKSIAASDESVYISYSSGSVRKLTSILPNVLKVSTVFAPISNIPSEYVGCSGLIKEMKVAELSSVCAFNPDLISTRRDESKLIFSQRFRNFSNIVIVEKNVQGTLNEH